MIGVFTQMWGNLLTWFVGIFADVTEIFVTTSTGGAYELTFIGTCALVMAGFSAILLAFNLIRSFVKLRG